MSVDCVSIWLERSLQSVRILDVAIPPELKRGQRTTMKEDQR